MRVFFFPTTSFDENARTRRAALGGILLALVLVAGGCWDRKEINELALVSAVGIDKVDGRFVVTAEFFHAAAIESGGGWMGGTAGGGAAGRVVIIGVGSGDTLLAAIRELALKVPRRVFFAHTAVAVIGEELARSGIREVLDLWDRSPELRRTTFLLVTRGQAQRVISSSQSGLERTIGREVLGIAREVQRDGHGRVTRMHDALLAIGDKTRSIVLGVIQLSPEPEPPPKVLTAVVGAAGGTSVAPVVVTRTIRLNGAAAFRNDKLAYWLDARETRGLLWITNRVKTAVVSVTAPGSESAEATIEITRSSSSIKSEIKDGSPIITIAAKIEGNLGDISGTSNPTKPAQWKSLERRAATAIKNEMLSVIARAKKEKTDIFGFGEAVHRQHPKEWRKMKENWQEIFADMPVKFDIRVSLRRSGLTTSPPTPK